MIESFKLPTITPETLTGSICSFNDEYGNLPLKSCVSQIQGYQEGSGIPNPTDNIRPLVAWSSDSLGVNTINQWDEQWEKGKYSASTGKKEVSNNTIRSKNFIKVIPNTDYYCKAGELTINNLAIFFYDNNHDFISFVGGANTTFVTPINCYYITFYCANTYGTTYNNDISINYPATDIDYHAFNGAVFNFGQDIYQGEIDWKRGVVTKTTTGKITFSSSDIDTVRYEDYSNNVYRVTMKNAFYDLNNRYLIGVCNKLTFKSDYNSVNSNNNSIAFNNNNGMQLILRNDELANEQDVIDFISTLECVYPLATPIEIPLGGIQLLTQEGQNNIFADCGNSTVEYLKVN